MFWRTKPLWTASTRTCRSFRLGKGCFTGGSPRRLWGDRAPLSVRPPVNTVRTIFKTPPKRCSFHRTPPTPPATSFSASQRRPFAYIFSGKLHPVCHKKANFAVFSKHVPEITKMCNLPCSGYPENPDRSPIQPRIKVGEIHSSRVPETANYSS